VAVRFQIAAIMIFVAVLLSVVRPGISEPPSDQEIITRFRQHLAEYERLRAMIRQDSISSLGIDHAFALSYRRQREYRHLLRQTRVRRINYYDENMMKFVIWSRHVEGRNPYKGIAWIENARLLPDLGEIGKRYMRIQGNWCLYEVISRTSCTVRTCPVAVLSDSGTAP